MKAVTVKQAKISTTKKTLFGMLSLLLLAAGKISAAPQTQSSQSLSQIQGDGPSARKLKGSWNFTLANSQYQDEFNQKNMTTAEVGVNISYDLTSILRLRLDPRFSFETGYLQTENEGTSSQSYWTAKEASANLAPWEYLEISAGALNQSALHTKIILDDIAFPAARLTLQNSSKENIRFGFKAQTAIATSSSLATDTKEFEPTPTFNSAGLFVQGQWSRVRAGFRANYFQFNNLPSSLATVSGLLGNSVTATSNDISEFTYSYRGYEVAANTEVLFGRFAYEIKGAMVKNTSVASNLSDGFRVENALAMKVHPEWKVGPSYEYFRIEPDAVVANYNAKSLTANRVGYRAGLAVEMLKIFKAGIKAGVRDVVFESPSQSREKTLDLELETLNVPF